MCEEGRQAGRALRRRSCVGCADMMRARALIRTAWRSVGWHASAVTWVLLQQAVVRALVAVKFLLLGRMLGPAAVGAIGGAMLALTIAEALSDTGLAQAIVQARDAPTDAQLGGALTMLALRGVVIGCFGFALAPLLASAFRLGDERSLFFLAAVAPLFRGMISPAYFVAQRERQFRYVACVETSAGLTDCATAVGLAAGGVGPAAALVGTLCADLLKVALSWKTLSTRVPIGASWKGVADYLRFSRWVWGASVVTLALNQFDKVFVARLLGAESLGAYQVASRLAQMLLADGAMAMSQYLFPTLAAHHREHPRLTAQRFLRTLVVAACLLTVCAIGLRAIAEPLVIAVLGRGWLSAIPLFRAFVVNMSVCALIALLVAYVRAAGMPKAVTQATILQGMLLVVLVPLAFRWWGVIGIVRATTAGLSATALYLSIVVAKSLR